MNITDLNPMMRPTDAVMPSVPQDVMIVLFSVVVIACAVWAIRRAVAKGDRRPLILLAAAVPGALLEGFACFLIHCHHTAIGQYNLYRAFDVHVPLWVLGLYMVFFGLTVFLLIERFSRPFSGALFWGVFASVAISEAIFEIYCIHAGILFYYGVQPISISGFPLHMSFVNGALAVTYTAFATVWFRIARGEARYLLIPLTPIFLWGIYAALVTPLAASLFGLPDFALAGSLVTIAEAFALSSLALWVLKRMQVFEEGADAASSSPSSPVRSRALSSVPTSASTAT